MRVEATVKATGAGFMLAALLGLSVVRGGSPILLFTALFLGVSLAVSYAEAARNASVLDSLLVERRLPERVGEGSHVTVSVTVENPSPRSLPYLIVEDRPPARLKAAEARGRVPLGGGGSTSLSYKASPAPGYHVFSELILSTGDPLGFFASYRVIGRVSSLSVAPLSLREAAGGSVGLGAAETIASRRRGASLEYYQLREYQYGDDPRFISWPATARTGKYMVREGLSEAMSGLGVFIDLSGPSWPGTPGEAPADWMMRLAVTAVGAAARGGGSVWYTILRGEVWETWGPLRGRDAVELLRQRLSLVGPDNVAPRLKLGESLYRFHSTLPSSAPRLLLLGPGVGLERAAEALESAPTAACTALAVIVAPTGGSRLEEAVRRVESRFYEEYRSRLSRLGVALGLIKSGGDAYEYARVIEKGLSRGRFC